MTRDDARLDRELREARAIVESTIRRAAEEQQITVGAFDWLAPDGALAGHILRTALDGMEFEMTFSAAHLGGLRGTRAGRDAIEQAIRRRIRWAARPRRIGF
jgi:hypothetical protein